MKRKNLHKDNYLKNKHFWFKCKIPAILEIDILPDIQVILYIIYVHIWLSHELNKFCIQKLH